MAYIQMKGGSHCILIMGQSSILVDVCNFVSYSPLEKKLENSNLIFFRSHSGYIDRMVFMVVEVKRRIETFSCCLYIPD